MNCRGAGGIIDCMEMRKTWIRILTTTMTIGMMALIFFFSTEPAVKSDSTSGIIAERAADVVRPGWRKMPVKERKTFFDQVQHVVRKCAHFTEFMLLGFSMRLCLESWMGKRKPLSGLAWAGGTIYAALDEMQIMVDGRSAQIRDAGIDCAGVLAGVLLAVMLTRLTGRRKNNESKEDTGT